MYQNRFQHLSNLNRKRIPEPPNIRMRLHRNERPESWPSEFVALLGSTIPTHIFERYPDPTILYEKLAAFVGVIPDQLLITSGIDEQVKTLIMLACGEGDEICVPWPSYAMYKVYADIFGAGFKPIPYYPDSIVAPEDIIGAISPRTRILFLPNPNQPVENCFTPVEVETIAIACARNDTILAVDEAYFYYGAPTCIGLIEKFDNLVVMRTLSKAFGGAGLRLGFAVGQERVLGPMKTVRLAHECNSLSIHAGIMLLDRFDEYVEPSIRDICAGRSLVREQCRQLDFKTWGSVSNNVLIDLGSEETKSKFISGLEAQGVFVKGNFDAPMNHHILIGCGSVALMSQFMEIFKAISKSST
jgi:histidinol-phosphate aminotransferase